MSSWEHELSQLELWLYCIQIAVDLVIGYCTVLYFDICGTSSTWIDKLDSLWCCTRVRFEELRVRIPLEEIWFWIEPLGSSIWVAGELEKLNLDIVELPGVRCELLGSSKISFTVNLELSWLLVRCCGFESVFEQNLKFLFLNRTRTVSYYQMLLSTRPTVQYIQLTSWLQELKSECRQLVKIQFGYFGISW